MLRGVSARPFHHLTLRFTMNRTFLLLSATALTAGTLLLAQTDQAPASPQSHLSVTTGVDYSRGDYGLSEDTTVLSVPLDVAYENGPWLLRVVAPWLTIDGPATIVGSAGGNTRPVTNSNSGLGDVVVGATYRAGPVAGDVEMDVTARAKLPTADDDRGLGTGEADYYAQIDLHRTVGAFTPFVSVGWRALGDNARYQLRDGVYAGGGTHYRASERTVLTASLDWSERIVAGGDPATSVLAAVTHDLNADWRVMGYALKGFTDASPDVGGGLQLTYRF